MFRFSFAGVFPLPQYIIEMYLLYLLKVGCHIQGRNYEPIFQVPGSNPRTHSTAARIMPILNLLNTLTDKLEIDNVQINS
jgi:hypothetical protein